MENKFFHIAVLSKICLNSKKVFSLVITLMKAKIIPKIRLYYIKFVKKFSEAEEKLIR